MNTPPPIDKPDPNESLIAVLQEIRLPLSGYLQQLEKERRSTRTWTFVKRAAISAAALVFVSMWLFVNGNMLGVSPQVLRPTVAQVEIGGEIGPNALSSADRIVPLLTSICGQPMIKGLVLHINSPGGSPGDAERIGAAIDACKAMPADLKNPSVAKSARARRPVLAVIDGMGASAAYMIAVHADQIWANPTGFVGSIGVILEGLKFNGLMQKIGVSSYTYASGSLKSMLSPVSDDTPAQRAVAQDLANSAMEAFKADVIAHRSALKQETKDLWSGRVWVAGQAKEIGLIDEIGLLEPVERSAFKGLDVQRYEPQRNVRDALTMTGWVHAIAAEVVSQMQEH